MQPHHKWLVSQQDSDEIGLKLAAMDCRLVSFTLPGAKKGVICVHISGTAVQAHLNAVDKEGGTVNLSAPVSH